MASRVEELVSKYDLTTHPEGGFYKEIYRSPENALINGKSYSVSTNIYFLLRSFQYTGDFSAWHMVIDTDEAWHHLEGNDIEIFILNEAGHISTHTLGKSANAAHVVTVPKNVWFAAKIVDTDKDGFSLISCTCSPGFDFSSFRLADRKHLLDKFPHQKELITDLSR